MASFGIASQVLKIVPASNKAERPSASGARETDQGFLNHLEQAIERRDEALDRAAARAEARETASATDNATPRGESVSEAARNQEMRKEKTADGTAQNSDNDPVTGGDEITNEPISAEDDAAPGHDDEQPTKSAAASTEDGAGESGDTGSSNHTSESVAPETTTAGSGDNPMGPTAPDTATATSPVEGEIIVAATGTPYDSEDVTSPLAATGDADEQAAMVPGNADDAVEGAAAPAAVSTAPAPVLQAGQAGDADAPDGPVQPVPATDTAAQPVTGAKDDVPAEIAATAAATPGTELASAVSGAMSATGKGSGKPQENAGQTSHSEGPKVVLTPKSDGEIKRPMSSGNVQVAGVNEAEAGTADASSKSKGFTPTVVPGQRQTDGQTTQTGLQNALASVTENPGGESNSALKLASLVNSASTAPSNSADAPKAAPATTQATAPLPQTAAAGVANPQALQNSSSLSSPLRAAPPPPPNPAAFQVAIHVARALDDGLERINIRLHPANLGRVDVKIEVAQDGRVTATVIADKADTLDMLQRDSRALERALQEAGLRTDSESLNFGLRGERDHGKAGESGEDKQHADGQDDDGLDDVDMHGVIPPSRPLSAQAGALDIFV